MAYPAGAHSCVHLQVCPVTPPGQAEQTPMWMAIWPCVHSANRAGVNVGMPQTPAPFNQEKMRSQAAPALRILQQQGSVAPSCRGAACSADEFIESITTRFQLHQRGVGGQEKLKGKHVLVLLPEGDPQAIASINWLLDQHAEFSGRGGRVILNEQAIAWLKNDRGAIQLDSVNAPTYKAAAQGLEKLEREIAELVRREKLGAPPAFAGASFQQLKQQFAAWLKKAKTIEALTELNNQSLKFSQLLQIVSDHAVNNILQLGMKDGLTISVLAGAHAQWATMHGQQLRGLIVSPAAQWNAKELTASLRGRGVLVELRDLKHQPIPDQQLLNRKLLVAVLDGENPQQLTDRASHLVAGLVNHPSGKVPVTVLSLADSLPVYSQGQLTRVLDDPILEKILPAVAYFDALATELLKLIRENSSIKEPLPENARESLDFKSFATVARGYVDAFASKDKRKEGYRLLESLESTYPKVIDLQVQRWKAIFAAAKKLMEQNSSDKGLYILPLVGNRAVSPLALLGETPELAKLAECTVMTRVEPVMVALPLTPDVKEM